MRNKQATTELARLRKENRKLKRENRRLHAALADADSPFSENGEEYTDPRVAERIQKASLYRKRSFFLYLFSSFRTTLLYGLAKRAVTYFRRYRMTILILQILLFIFTVPRNGAVFLALSALSAVVLPAFAVLLVVLSQRVSLRKGREKQLLNHALNECSRIYVFKLPKKNFPKKTDVLLPFLNSIAREDNAAILLISPFLFSKKGLKNGRAARYYVAAREEAPRIFLLREYFYFRARSRFPMSKGFGRTVFY